MKFENLKIGQTASIKHTDLNEIPPPRLSMRESVLMNTRLDTMWTYLSQLGLPVEAFIFAKETDNGRTSAKIILTKDYCVTIDVKYLEPLESISGKTDSIYTLYKGKQKLAEGAHISNIKNELKALPICKTGIVTQNQ